MKLYLPPPLEWHENTARTPFTEYQILFDKCEKSHVCHYYNFAEREKGIKFGKIDELRQWVETTHYTAQIKKHFIEIKLKKWRKRDEPLFNRNLV